ncbi:unnamed protein product [Lampetra planeri]
MDNAYTKTSPIAASPIAASPIAASPIATKSAESPIAPRVAPRPIAVDRETPARRASSTRSRTGPSNCTARDDDDDGGGSGDDGDDDGDDGDDDGDDGDDDGDAAAAATEEQHARRGAFVSLSSPTATDSSSRGREFHNNICVCAVIHQLSPLLLLGSAREPRLAKDEAETDPIGGCESRSNKFHDRDRRVALQDRLSRRLQGNRPREDDCVPCEPSQRSLCLLRGRVALLSGTCVLVI